MASNRSRRGRRILSAREAAQWDEDRIRRFKEDQWRKRNWIKFTEIAEWYSDLRGPVSPEKAAALREQAHSMLKSGLLARLFEEGGPPRVLFRFPGVDFTRGKMTSQRLQDAIDNDPDGEYVRLLLSHCWLPRDLFERWCARHHLPKSPSRFQPQETHAVPTALARNETAATRNKGGAPPKADWDALKEPLRAEIKKHGYPHPQNPPGWQRTKDVVDWALTMLGTT